MIATAMKEDLDNRARERYTRARRLEWSIQCWGDRRGEIERMIGLLKEALKVTRDELEHLEQEMGHKIKERRND